MTIKLSGKISISDIIAEFRGAQPASLSSYYAGGGNVPLSTVGFPDGVRTPVPQGGRISLSNFYGASDEFRTSFSLFGIRSAGSDADNLFFGGDIPRTGNDAGEDGVFINRNSNDFRTFTIPPGYSNLTISTTSFSVQLAAGFTYFRRFRFSTERFYYDFQRNFGIMIYDETAGAVVGYVRNTTSENQFTFDPITGEGKFNTYTVPAGTINISSSNLLAGKTYRVYYTCDFKRNSDAANFGDWSFGWFNNSTPFIQVLANALPLRYLK